MNTLFGLIRDYCFHFRDYVNFNFGENFIELIQGFYLNIS